MPAVEHERRWLGLALLLVLLFSLPLLTYPFGRDQGEFAQMADAIQRGLAPYKDAWNPKPPLTFFLYAAILSVARQMLAVDILNVAIILATAGLLYALARRLFGGLIGIVAALSYGLAIAAYEFWYQSQSDGWMNLPLVAAAYCFVRSRSGSLRWLLGSGAALGLAFGFKYTGAALGLVILLLVWCWPADPLRDKLAQLGALAAGFALAVLPWLLFLLAHGAVGDWLESIATTNGYTRLSLLSPNYLSRIPIASGKFLALHMALSGLAALGGLLALIAALRQRKGEPASPPLNLLIWGWLLVSFLAVLAQGKLYAYQWQPLLPPLALAAALGFAALYQAARQAGLWAPAMVATLLVILLLAEALLHQGVYPDFLAYASGQQSAAQYNSRFENGDFFYPADVQAAAYLAAHTRPEQRAFIWGFEPLVYWLAGREPATRFIFNFPLVASWYPRAWQDEVITQLQQAPPVYIIVLHRDPLPMVNNVLEDSAGQLKYFPALADLLNSRYQFETQIEDFSFYRLK